jgi:hypothetical protein
MGIPPGCPLITLGVAVGTGVLICAALLGSMNGEDTAKRGRKRRNYAPSFGGMERPCRSSV